jgi:hypothetical protein
MNAPIEFLFREKLYKGEMFVDYSEYPCLIFVIVRDKELAEEFGDEITLKTDFVNLLPKKDDYPETMILREAIFSVARYTAVFLAAKEEYQTMKLPAPNNE